MARAAEEEMMLSFLARNAVDQHLELAANACHDLFIFLIQIGPGGERRHGARPAGEVQFMALCSL